MEGFKTLRDGREAIHALPQQGFIAPTSANTTPGQCARSFLIDSHTGAERIYTPWDENTFVSFPIVSNRQLPLVGQAMNKHGAVVADWNHNYHPRDALIHGSLEEQALRNVRIEWVHRDDHSAYHKEFYGPDIRAITDLLRPLLFGAAGFIPDHALNYDGEKKAKIVRLDDAQRLQLWESGRVRVANSILIRDALTHRALTNDFQGINEQVIDEFLHTGDTKRRFELGSSLLGVAVHDMTNPLREQYREIIRRQNLPPGAARTAGRCAMRMVCGHKRARALKALENTLLQARSAA